MVDQHVLLGGAPVGEEDRGPVVLLEPVVGDQDPPGTPLGEDAVAATGGELVVGDDAVAADEARVLAAGAEVEADPVVDEDGVADQVPGVPLTRHHAGAVLLLGEAADGEPVPGDVVGQQLHRPLGVEVAHHRLPVAPGAGGVAAGVGALEGQARGLDPDRLLIEARADPDGGAGTSHVDRALDGVEGPACAQAGPVAVLVVDDQDPAVTAMVPAGGVGRGQAQAERGDNREHHHCCTSLHERKASRARTTRTGQVPRL